MKLIKICDIDWTKAAYLGYGSYAVVYEVSVGVVAKVSIRITPAEMEAQRYFARKKKALPILEYAQGLLLPERSIHESCCSMHGETNGWEDECHCNRPVDVLLMPRAERVVPVSALALSNFMVEIEQECKEEIGRIWDRKSNNVAFYRNHLVALDFGNPES